MKNYQLKKDADGWTVWSFGKCMGRIYKDFNGNGWVALSYKEKLLLPSKERAAAFLAK